MGSKKRKVRSQKKQERAAGPSYFLFLTSCFTLFAFTSFLFLPPVSAQENNDYEELVQRNLELRQKLKTLEDKYTALENERNVLIVHIRNLQAEKDKLAQSGGAREGEPSGDELKAAFGEVSKELSLVAKERDQLKKEFTKLKEMQFKSEAAIKALEEEKAKLNEEIGQIQSTFQVNQKESAAAFDSLATEKAGLADQIAFLKETFEKEKETLLAQQHETVLKTVEEEKTKLIAALEEMEKKSEEERMALEEKQRVSLAAAQEAQEKIHKLMKQLAMEEGLYQVKREEMDARINALMAEQEELKVSLLALTQKNEVWAQKLKKADEEKKRIEEKSLRTHDEIRALQADFQKKEDHWRKEANAAVIEKKELRKRAERLEKAERLARKELADSEGKMADFEVRIKKMEEEMKARQITLREYEALIRKLTAENTNLQTKLAHVPPAQTKISRFLGKKRMFLTPEDKQRLDMHFNLAVTYDKTGLYKQEEQEYLECLKIDSSDANVHYNLAVLYDDKLNDNTKAISHYKKYMELKPLSEDNDKVKQWLLYAEEEIRLNSQVR